MPNTILSFGRIQIIAHPLVRKITPVLTRRCAVIRGGGWLAYVKCVKSHAKISSGWRGTPAPLESQVRGTERLKQRWQIPLSIPFQVPSMSGLKIFGLFALKKTTHTQPFFVTEHNRPKTLGVYISKFRTSRSFSWKIKADNIPVLRTQRGKADSGKCWLLRNRKQSLNMEPHRWRSYENFLVGTSTSVKIWHREYPPPKQVGKLFIFSTSFAVSEKTTTQKQYETQHKNSYTEKQFDISDPHQHGPSKSLQLWCTIAFTFSDFIYKRKWIRLFSREDANSHCGSFTP